MDPTGECPCVDGLPDPCTLCGEAADGTCQLGTLKMWRHRAEKAEAERDALVSAVIVFNQAVTDWRAGRHGYAGHDHLRDAHDRFKREIREWE
jgi:hypothetical protein